MSEEELLKKVIEELDASGVKSEKSDFYAVVERKSKEKESSLADHENAGIIEMRRIWSTCILALIVGIVLFDFMLVTMYGLGIWTFENQTVVIVVIVDNFLKIIGLGFIITHNIFKKIFNQVA